MEVHEKEISEVIITDWDIDDAGQTFVEADDERNCLDPGEFWDGNSVEARVGLLFRSRSDVKTFMDRYKKEMNCQYCIFSGGVSEKCTTKKVGRQILSYL